MTPMDTFTTARLTAERLRPDHLDDLIPLHLDEAVSRTLGGTRTAEQTAAYVLTNLGYWDQNGFGLWIVRDHAGQFMGRAGIRPLDLQGVREIEIAYTFHQAYWGQGYASEIAEALRDIAFGPLALPDLVGIVLIDHWPSRKVLEKTGLIFERAYQDQGHDMVLYRMRNPKAAA